VGYGVYTDKIWFQKNGARLHTAIEKDAYSISGEFCTMYYGITGKFWTTYYRMSYKFFTELFLCLTTYYATKYSVLN